MFINEFIFEFYTGKWNVYYLEVKRETPLMYYCDVLNSEGKPYGSKAAVKKEDIDKVKKVGNVGYQCRIQTFDTSVNNAKAKMRDYIIDQANYFYKEN